MSIFAAFILALLTALLFAPGYRKGSYAPLAIFFLILFMAGIASQYWIAPIGPAWGGVSWLPLLFIILIFTFLFAAPSPYERSRATKNEVATAVTVAMSIFIWLLFLMLLMAIVIGVFTKTALLSTCFF